MFMELFDWDLDKISIRYCGGMAEVFLLYFFLERSSANFSLTWFDVLDMGVPAPEEMAGCEYIMSDLIGGKT